MIWLTDAKYLSDYMIFVCFNDGREATLDLNTRSRIPLPRRKPGGGQANYEVAFGRFACDLRLCSIVP